MELTESTVKVLAVSWPLCAGVVIVVAGVRDLRRRKRATAPRWAGYGSPFLVTAALALVIQGVTGAFTGATEWKLTLIMAGVNGLAATAVVFLLALREGAPAPGARAVQLVGVTVGVAGGLAGGAGLWAFG
ncbi:hypothetical protein ACWF94_12510 [Streptomyces sp. NPDC055078]